MTPFLRLLLVAPFVVLSACGGEGPSGPDPQNPYVEPPGGTPTEPTTPTTPSTPAPADRVTLNTSVRYQTIDGWAVNLRMWEEDKTNNRYDASVEAQANAVYKFLVDSVGINSVRLEIPSGMENPTNRWGEFKAGRLAYTSWQKTRFEKVNDNADPNVANMAGFNLSNLDYRVQTMLLPLKAALEARGEKLHINVNYTDFKWDDSIVQGTLSHANNPAEFAEFVTVCFIHLRDKYGIIPDAFEVILEPDNTEAWRGATIGAGVVAAVDRLKANGFTPEVIAPSNATMANALNYFGYMAAVPGALSRVKNFAYHRYGAPQASEVAAIRARAQASGLKTSMLELVGGRFEDLYEDLTVGHVSAWQQWAAAAKSSASDNGGYYARVDATNPASPKISMAKLSPQLSQVFRFVRRGAVRVESASSNGNRRTMAFVNSDGLGVVVVKASAATGKFAVVGLPAGRYAQRFVSDGVKREDIAPVTVAAGGWLEAELKEEGVLTIYGVK